MKKIIAATTVALALATTASAELKVGLGYNLAEAFNGGTTNVRVPLDFADIGNGLRIEPELGYGSQTRTRSSKDLTNSQFLIAVGGYYNLWTSEKLSFYAGGRLGITNGTDESIDISYDVFGNPTTSVKSNDYSSTGLQGLFGAEYGITEDFTIAAQAGLELNFGDRSSTATVGQVILRYFFLPVGGSSASSEEY